MFENIDYIYEIYKQKSFSKAAKALFINQSSLSLTIQKAEKNLGMTIFNRKTKPVTLTEFGVRYIEAIEKINAISAEIQDYIDHTASEVTGCISIGAASFCVTYILPDLISAFNTLYPHVLINLQEFPTVELAQHLQKNAIDLMICSEQIQLPRYESHPLYGERMVLVVPQKWIREGDKEKLACLSPIEVFQSVPFIMLRKGNSNRSRLENLMKKYQIRIRPILETDQNISACSMACSGVGAAIVSDLIADRLCTGKAVQVFNLEEPEMKRINYISCAESSGFLVHEFIRIAQQAFAKSPGNLTI